MKHIHFLLILAVCPGVALGQLDFEQPPINYSSTTPTDPVQQLANRIQDGNQTLQWDADSGFLKSLLKVLEIPESSQTLVFSKTSLQVSRISPRTPRAIYFNDDVYVGWVQHGDMIEISAADPALGATFYTLKQDASLKPVLKRETSRCLQCHGSTHTRRVPGHIVRSVYSDKRGFPIFRLGTHISEPRSEMSERFGGWYVTGKTGQAKHIGNAWIEDPGESEQLDQSNSFDVQQLDAFVNTSVYLSRHSDVIALMVLQHQSHVHNVLTAANHSGILTQRDALIMNKALDRQPEFQSDSTVRRYDSAAEKVLKAILGSDQADLNGPLIGTSSFQADFEALGPFDPQGRSLREIDGSQRLFKYPCSFLIYSKPFQQLHHEVQIRVVERLSDMVTTPEQKLDPDFEHLAESDRHAIRQILTDTNAISLQGPSIP